MYYIKESRVVTASKKSLFVWSILILMAVVAVSDVGRGAVEAIASEPKNVEIDASASEDVSADKTIQSITFKKDMRITDALRFLALKYNKNIVPSPKVEGNLGFTSLFGVTFEEAMEAILGGKFEYEQKENLIEVFPRGDESRMKYEVFKLHYVSAAEAKKLIMPVLSANGRIGLTSPAATGVPTGESISSPKGGGDTMSLKDTIVVYDYAENIRRAREVIATIDLRPKQVLVETTILSANLTENMELGIDWQTLKGSAITAVGDITRKSPDFLSSAGTGAVSLSGGMTVGLAKGDIAAFIHAVEEVTDVTILANPKILAVNKQLGQVYIGRKVGYRDGDTFDASGNRVEGEVKFLDTGTKLSFRPYIGDDGYIRMDIHSKDSSDQTSGNIPSEDSAELVSNVMVRDGGTVVIGGLFRDEITTGRTQIPFLGDLPIIGALFRGTSDKVVRKEVMVLLTPHIIEEPSETDGEARMADVERKRHGARMGQQWEGRARLAEDNYANAVKDYINGDSEEAMQKLDFALEIRPTYFEALRLKERIVNETDVDAAAMIDRKVLDIVEHQEASNWRRR